MTSATTSTTTTGLGLRVIKVLGVMCAISLPLLGLVGTALALVVAAVLASRGRRKEALIVSGVALAVLLILLVLAAPVHTGDMQIRRG